MKKPWWKILARRNACPAAIVWARKQPSLQVAWQKCTKSAWMRWWLVSCRIKTPEHRSGVTTRNCAGCKFERLSSKALRRLYPRAPRPRVKRSRVKRS